MTRPTSHEHKRFGGPLIALAASTALLVAACATEPRRDTTPPPEQVPSGDARRTPAETPPAAEGDTPQARDEAARMAGARGDDPYTPLGIEACDELMRDYRACQTTLGTSPEMIEQRYERLAQSLAETARGEGGRERVEVTCNNLQELTDEALDGRDCAEPVEDLDADVDADDDMLDDTFGDGDR